MTEHDALLAAICANPACDTARLVFADHLQENGEPERAEYIRRAVRDLGITTTLRAGQALGLDRKWRYWRAEWEPRYVEIFKAPLRPINFRYTLVRGFLEAIDGPASDWLDFGDSLRVALHPVTKVKLTTIPAIEQAGSKARMARLAGREWRSCKQLGVRLGESLALPLLNAEWPGVTFELTEPT